LRVVLGPGHENLIKEILDMGDKATIEAVYAST